MPKEFSKKIILFNLVIVSFTGLVIMLVATPLTIALIVDSNSIAGSLVFATIGVIGFYFIYTCCIVIKYHEEKYIRALFIEFSLIIYSLLINSHFLKNLNTYEFIQPLFAFGTAYLIYELFMAIWRNDHTGGKK